MIHDHPFRFSFTTCFKERHIVRFLEPTPGHKILEVGCGSAYLFSVLNRAFPQANFEYHGIDIQEDALAVAKQLFGESVHLSRGDVTAIPYADASFDQVLYLDVIEHVKDDAKSLAEVKRVLKPGGKLILSTPNLDAPLTDTFFCNYLHDEGGMLNQRHGYTVNELYELFGRCGFLIQRTAFSNIFVTELLITLTKLGYRLKRSGYDSQASVFEMQHSLLFELHKYTLFPVGYWLGRLEEFLFGSFFPGHCVIVEAKKKG